MRLLHHFILQPDSRKVRLLLGEKDASFETRNEHPWALSQTVLDLNPAGDLPVMIEPDGAVIADSHAICEFIEETCPHPPLIGHGATARAEVRRLAGWFDTKFAREVSAPLLHERLIKRLGHGGSPDSQAIRESLASLRRHLDHIGYLVNHRRWLAGDSFSLADIAAAAHLSVIDYLGDVPWDGYPDAKNWYASIKSRPTFRPLLLDQVPGIPPAAHYTNLDF